MSDVFFLSPYIPKHYFGVATTFTVLFDVILGWCVAIVVVACVYMLVRPVSNNNNDDDDDDVVNDVRTDTLNHIGLSIGAPYS